MYASVSVGTGSRDAAPCGASKACKATESFKPNVSASARDQLTSTAPRNTAASGSSTWLSSEHLEKDEESEKKSSARF